MIYKCGNCGLLFPEHNVKMRCELVDKFWGSPAYQAVRVCPDCRSKKVKEYIPNEGKVKKNERNQID